MPAGRPPIPEERRKPLVSQAVVARIHVRLATGRKTTISLDPALLNALADRLGGRASAREWLREQVLVTSYRPGRSLSRTIQVAAIRYISKPPLESDNPL